MIKSQDGIGSNIIKGRDQNVLSRLFYWLLSKVPIQVTEKDTSIIFFFCMSPDWCGTQKWHQLIISLIVEMFKRNRTNNGWLVSALDIATNWLIRFKDKNKLRVSFLLYFQVNVHIHAIFYMCLIERIYLASVT